MLSKLVTLIGGNPNKREIEKIAEIADAINAFESDFEKLSDDALRAKTEEFRARLAGELAGIEDEKERQQIEQAVLEDLLPEAFAAVREASKRTIGQRHYDVQMIGGAVLNRGNIAEMRTGEGKTLVATLPLYLNAITGRGVHLVTVNDYLARRDARWMGPIYHALGLSVGILQMAAVTENGKKAFVYDPAREHTREDQNKLRLVDRVEAYKADITYGTNSEYGFDYLRDNMTMNLNERVQRGHYYAIVDEVDNVLIDEARTPLIISGPASGDLEWYPKMAALVRQLKPEDYEISEKDRNVALTEVGLAHVEQLLGEPLSNPDRPEDLTPEQARALGYLEQAMRAQFLFRRNKEYLVQGGKVVIVDEFTGRLMPGRRWSDGLHQAVEAKEGVKVEPENITYATITLQNYFRMYQKLAGMTGTGLTEAEEFFKIYKLNVLPIPTNLEYNATRPNSPLIEVKAKDENGYEYNYFARREDADKAPIFYRRKDYPDIVYRTVESKLRAIVQEILHFHVIGRPMLVGSTSVENSDHLSNRMRAEAVRRLLQVLLVRRAWFVHNDREEDGRLFDDLIPLYQPLETIEPGFLRQFSKPFGVSINPDDPENLETILSLLDLQPEHAERLKAVIQGGVPHQVLNARRHTEESQIIASAGAFGAVTIATNMAGRGVDIKLGGELTEEIISAVNRVLRKGGVADPYDMIPQERREAIQKMNAADFGLYEAEVNFFLKYFEDMEKVRALGGLHVIGSERHEARRIDNQLRGRSARQGDPGSSRFYLALEDDLMRMFGGEQISGLMERIKADEMLPLENRMVGNIIEGSQHRVEGANFDVRKHLLEYDDVLNAQRIRIYGQRDRVFTKEDLTGDIAELLQGEIKVRLAPALADEEGPWRLLGWLEQTQPPFFYEEGTIFPSFTYQLLIDELAKHEGGDPKAAIMELVRRSVEAEDRHILKAIESLVQKTAEGLETQLAERFDALDTFLEGMADREEKPRAPEAIEELSAIVHIPVRLNNEQAKALINDPQSLEDALKEAVEQIMTQISIARVAGAIELRLGESLELDKIALAKMEWEEAAVQVMASAGKALEVRHARITDPKGQVAQDLDQLLKRDTAGLDESAMVRILASIAQGARVVFDAKTHKQTHQTVQRFNYGYLAGHLIEDMEADELETAVLEHLEEARETQREGWGASEFLRLSQNDENLRALSEEDQEAKKIEFGQRMVNQIYRQVLLGSITELWVEYLTKVEALRVSIGLEAYGQRDPLVQYKSRASEMFQALLVDIRASIISRVFLYQPRTWSAPLEKAEAQPAAQTVGKKKRKRH
jgi:preprotein translocase subunit SecA